MKSLENTDGKHLNTSLLQSLHWQAPMTLTDLQIGSALSREKWRTWIFWYFYSGVALHDCQEETKPLTLSPSECHRMLHSLGQGCCGKQRRRLSKHTSSEITSACSPARSIAVHNTAQHSTDFSENSSGAECLHVLEHPFAAVWNSNAYVNVLVNAPPDSLSLGPPQSPSLSPAVS